ncbi:hypothetical protein [Streptomyces sediminimaris]|uniref:hypothetical protein n=1 Tax=Streptomyces sediminimaris TaxID=3383721 RepID=UPI00399965E8
MVAEGPGRDGTPGDGSGVPPVPHTVWLQFLDDTEQAIRISAPREPSARERAAGARPEPAGPKNTRRRPNGRASGEPGADTVGELWEPQDAWPGEAWRDMDGPARRRRVGRALVAVVAVLVAVGTLSYGAGRSGAPGGRPGDTTSQQSEEVMPDGAPTETGQPSAPAYAGTPPPMPGTG